MARNDNRLYAQFTLDYADSHKIAPLSDAAFRAHVRMVLWSRRMMTDGKIPGAMAAVFAKPKVLGELTANDEESPSLVKVGNDYFLHDFLEHQTSRADIEAQTKRNADNGRRGGQARAKRVASELLSDSQAKSNTETETETETTSTEVEVKPRKRGTRIPEPFLVTAEMRQWATTRTPNVDVNTSTERFVNHWRAATRNATKLDWLATWHNWLLSDQEKAGTRNAPRQTAAQRNLSTVEYFAQQEGQLEIQS